MGCRGGFRRCGAGRRGWWRGRRGGRRSRSAPSPHPPRTATARFPQISACRASAATWARCRSVIALAPAATRAAISASRARWTASPRRGSHSPWMPFMPVIGSVNFQARVLRRCFSSSATPSSPMIRSTRSRQRRSNSRTDRPSATASATSWSDCSSNACLSRPDRRSAWLAKTSAWPAPIVPSSSAPRASGIFCIASPRLAALAASRSPSPAWPGSLPRISLLALLLQAAGPGRDLGQHADQPRVHGPDLGAQPVDRFGRHDCDLLLELADPGRHRDWIGLGDLDHVTVHRERHHTPPCPWSTVPRTLERVEPLP